MTPFGTTEDGREVHKITLTAGNLTVSLLTYGAILQDLRLDGIDHALTLGSDLLSDYEGAMRYHGPLIGPVVNRISNARVRIDGMVYELERNEKGRIHLHSGVKAAQHQVWNVETVSDDSLTLGLALPDGMCGLPGNRQITVTYTLTRPARLTMHITGTTDARTLMNFANHSYWNLDGAETWASHSLRIAADRYLPSTPDDYPTGEIAGFTDTAMDFREAQLINPGAPNLDHNFCLSETDEALRDVLWLQGQSGVNMTVGTTAPGIQIYDGRAAQRPGQSFYEGLAIEAQHWPDAPNNPHFPSILLAPGETYQQTTRWTFSGSGA
ncbi:aldose epimerase family protein [Cognatiyoonia sp. IB215446]|uniref:aldose epimerase family protein n=1 Tax=Cognatiyoonia sp. IB215446 TaxID=3097355 RepID=UPI002A0FC129|nr:aldose epimerase family protein [Cognatiyoonia sp. IB215446]MDX8347438.1 aldose epimerase family protein [Cognatiyoonia sp. IB215446]